MWLDAVIILLLILLNGFFALSEIAIVSAKKNKLEAANKNGSSGAARALRLQSDPAAPLEPFLFAASSLFFLEIGRAHV